MLVLAGAALALPLTARAAAEVHLLAAPPSTCLGEGCSAGDTRRLTLEQTVEAVMATSPRLQAARARGWAAEAQKGAARGALFPRVDVLGDRLRYTQPFTTLFPTGGRPLTLIPRAENTALYAASARQPLLGLGQRIERFAATLDLAEASVITVETAVADLRQALKTTYLRLFEETALAETAALSERTLDQQLDEARARLQAGDLTTADALRIEVARGEAQQQHIAADAQRATYYAALLELLGQEPDGPATEFLAPAALHEVHPPAALAALRARAMRHRLELLAGERRVSAADHQARAQLWALFPEVDLEANVTHVEGQLFAPRNAYYLGLRARWAAWEWGASWYESRRAAADAAALRHEVEDMRRQVGAEVAARRANLIAAINAVAVASLSVTAAEEAFRVTAAQIQVGVGTTTDLLAAQSAMSRARSNHIHARFEAAIAQVQLERAVGDD